jgi:hypothetical protein
MKSSFPEKIPEHYRPAEPLRDPVQKAPFPSKIPEDYRPEAPNPATLKVRGDDFVSQNYSPGVARLSRRLDKDQVATIVNAYGKPGARSSFNQANGQQSPVKLIDDDSEEEKDAGDVEAAERLAAELAEEKKAHEEEINKDVEIKAGASAKVAGNNREYYRNLQGKEWSELSQREQLELRAHTMLSSYKFDAAVGVVISMNTVTIGAELEYQCRGLPIPSYFQILEYFFFVVYAGELAIRFFAHGTECLVSGWVKFDAFLVFQGFSTIVVEPLIVAVVGVNVMDQLGPVNVFRVRLQHEPYRQLPPS